MKYRAILFVLLGIFILYMLSRAVNVNELSRQVSHFPKESLLFLCVLSVIISLLKSWRFFLLLRKNDVDVTFWQICKVYIAGQSTAPIPGGEIFRSVLLEHETGEDKKKTSGPVVMQALIVFFSSAVVAIIGSFIYGILINIALIALIAIMILIYLIWNKALFLKLFSWLNTHKRLKKHVTTLKATHQGVRNNLLHRGSDKKPGATFLFSLAIGIFSNIVGGLMIYTITQAYNLPISYLQSVYIYSMSIIIAALSGIVPGGVGLAEGGITGLLLLLKIAISNAVLIVLIFRFINLVFYIIVGFVFLMLFYSKTLIFAKKVKPKN